MTFARSRRVWGNHLLANGFYESAIISSIYFQGNLKMKNSYAEVARTRSIDYMK